MQVQTVEFAVTRNKGRITRVGRTSISQPKTKFKGGSIKWYEGKSKQKTKYSHQTAGGWFNYTEFDSLYVPFQQAVEQAIDIHQFSY